MTRRTSPFRLAMTAGLVIAAAALTPAALAGRGGTHGSSTTDPSLTLSATTVTAGDGFTASGCGYTVGAPVNVTVDSPSAEYFFSASVDANGCTYFGWWTSEPGQYVVNAYQSGNGNKQVLLGSASLTAV